MKIEVIKNRNQKCEKEIEAPNGIYFYDSKGIQYRISENKFGEIELNACDGSLIIEPRTFKRIIIMQNI